MNSENISIPYFSCAKCGCKSLWGPSFPCLCWKSIEEIEQSQQFQSGQTIYLKDEEFDTDEIMMARKFSYLAVR